MSFGSDSGLNDTVFMIWCPTLTVIQRVNVKPIKKVHAVVLNIIQIVKQVLRVWCGVILWAAVLLFMFYLSIRQNCYIKTLFL
jgi:hypothetical protein